MEKITQSLKLKARWLKTKSLFLLLLGLFLPLLSANGQAASYVFTHQAGTFTANPSSATAVSIVADDTASSLLPIGFNFVFGSSTYTDFYMSSNGFISFGTTGSSLNSNDLSAANAAQRPIIAPLWDDLAGASVSNSAASYSLSGTAPNRVLTIEWLNWEWNYGATTPTMSFQVKLYETTNVIEFVYNQEAGVINSGSASIGINDATGSGAGTYLNLETNMSAPTVTSSTSVTSISTKPASGQIFKFAPPPCLYLGTLTITNVALPTATLNLSVPSSVDIDVYITNGPPPTAATTPTFTVTAGQTTAPISGLSGASTYVVYVKYSCSSTGPTIGWVKALDFLTPCGIITTSFFEGFENAALGGWGNPTVPYCWTYLLAQGSGQGYVDQWSAPRTGSKGFYTSPSDGSEILLISPETANLGNGTKQLRFWATLPWSGYSNTKINVYRMNGTGISATKTLIQSIPLNTTGWNEYIVPLPVTTDDYFAFSFNGAPGQWPNIYLDDVYYEDLSPCIFPMNIQVSNISITGATITWDASLATSVTSYEYEVRTSGAPGSGATGFVSTGSIAAPGTSVPLTGLSGATTYYVYVRSVCSGSNGIWTMFPVKFDTLCPIFTNNFFQGFEGITDGNNNNPTYPVCWTYINGTNSQWSYAAVNSWYPKTGSKNYYMYREQYWQTADGDLMLVSPETNNLGNGTKQIRFSVRQPWTSGSIPKLVVYTLDANTGLPNKTQLQAISITGSTYMEYIIPLAGTTDDYFAFSLEHNNPDDYPEIVIDDIYYEDLTPCIFPMNLQVTNITTNSMTLSWNASLATGVTGYEYEIRTSGAAGSGTTGLEQTGIVPAPGTSINITGLSHSSHYTVYIRSICGTSNGMWTTFPVKFYTLCDVMTGNFFEGFENTNVGGWNNPTIPYCWSYFADNTDGYGYTSDWNQRTGNRGFYIYNYGNVINLVSPETNNLGAGTKRVRFYAKLGWGSGNLDVYTMNGNTSAATKTLAKSVALTTNWVEYIVYFPVGTTDDYFAFVSAANGISADIYIDDIYYEDAPDCKPIEDSTIKVTNVSKNQATITWQDLFNANPVAYEVEVRATGNPGTPGAAFIGITPIGVPNIVATGLSPSTEYKVYVRSYCSATDQSPWSGAIDLVTLCDYSDFISYTPSLALCGPQKAELSAVLVDPTAMAAWYDAENDAVPLFEGDNFVSDDDITQNRSFWLRSRKTTPDTAVKLGKGTGSDMWEFGQFLYYGYGGMRHQYIYTAAELTQAGLTAGPISALKFDVVTTGSNPRPDFSISIGTTTSSTAAIPLVSNSLLTQVYAPVSQTFSTGVNTLTFNTSYVWDGVSNLVVQTNWSANNWGNSSGAVKYHQTTTNKTSIVYGYNVSASALLATDVAVPWDIYASTTNKRPNIEFVGVAGCVSPAIEIPVTVDAKPAFELSSSMVTSCEGGVTTTPVTITTNLGGYDTFVWTPSTGVSGDAVNGWTFSTATEQDYVLSATQSNGICEHLKTVRVFAGKKPVALSTLASTYDLCKNVVQEMAALEALPASVSIGAGLGTTASTSEVSAFVQSGVYSKQQYIYSAAELLAQGLTAAGYITDLSFETINSGASLSNPKYTIKMMSTPNTSFGTTNFETGNLATVFSKENHTHTFQGIQTMVFDSPFYWDGQSNILVEITQEGAGAGNNAETYFTAVAGTNVGIYTTSATDANPATGTRTTSRLNATFGLEQAAVTWSPTSNLYLDAATTIPYTTGVNALKVYVVSSLGGTQVYNATLTAPSGCSLEKPITVNVTDVVTPVIQNQTFCQATPVSSVVVTSGPTATFNFYNSATATTPITTISQTGTYYVEAVQGNCKSVRVPFTATITPLGLPTAQFTQVVCGGGTVSALMASGVTGSQIKWYATATSTTPLAGTQALVNNTTYYASQVLGTCESGRVAVLVNINTAPAALTPQTISICGTLNYGSVSLNQIAGADLVWYASSTSQTPIPNTDQIVNGTYYVSQKVNGCESLRVQVIASAQGSVAAPTASIQNICGSGTVAQLVAQILPNATAEWYSSATATTPLAPTTALINGTYYVSQRVDNCVSVKVAVAVRVISTSAPAVGATSMCAGSVVSDISLPTPSGVSYNWYLNSTSTTPLPSTDILQSGYYFVARVENGCESLRTQVQITVNSRPNSPSGATPQTFTDYAEISNLIMNEPNVVWYATYDDAMKGINALSKSMPLVKGTTYYAVIIGANGCPSLPTPIEARIVLGVNDFDLSKLKYYPNPVNDVLTITYTDVITNVEVFDLNGRMVIKRDFDNQTVQLDFSSLSAGTYMLNIKTKENSQFVKIVKK